MDGWIQMDGRMTLIFKAISLIYSIPNLRFSAKYSDT